MFRTWTNNPVMSRVQSRHFHSVVAFCVTMMFAVGATGKDPFSFSTEIGSAHTKAGVVCLDIHNSQLQPGDRVLLIDPAPPQSISEARIVGGASGACADLTDLDSSVHYYQLRVVKGRSAPSMPAIAVHTTIKRLKRKGDSVTGDIDQDGRGEYFRSCGSSEGLHLTVWSGIPLEGVLRWHHYYYLGYDIKPTCTEREMPSR